MKTTTHVNFVRRPGYTIGTVHRLDPRGGKTACGITLPDRPMERYDGFPPASKFLCRRCRSTTK